MIHEFKLFFCQDEQSGNPFLAVKDDSGDIRRAEIEDIISDSVKGGGPYPVLVKVDDLRMEMDLDQLWRRHQTCAAGHKKMVFTDASSRKVRFQRPIANSRFPYSMIVTDADGEETTSLFSVQGHCMSGNSSDDLMEYIIEKR